ncbi:hypothetical protein FOA52_013944 [Chlamydomonas sp. UWO 241]|nr:hypothetical protein FOA52_013944 [Chlamydomonas sp. UWO 241]
MSYTTPFTSVLIAALLLFLGALPSDAEHCTYAGREIFYPFDSLVAPGATSSTGSIIPAPYDGGIYFHHALAVVCSGDGGTITATHAPSGWNGGCSVMIWNVTGETQVVRASTNVINAAASTTQTVGPAKYEIVFGTHTGTSATGSYTATFTLTGGCRALRPTIQLYVITGSANQPSLE